MERIPDGVSRSAQAEAELDAQGELLTGRWIDTFSEFSPLTRETVLAREAGRLAAVPKVIPPRSLSGSSSLAAALSLLLTLGATTDTGSLSGSGDALDRVSRYAEHN